LAFLPAIVYICRYCPAIKEDQIDPKVVSFHPNDARKSIFTGKLFLFLEKKQVSLYANTSEICYRSCESCVDLKIPFSVQKAGAGCRVGRRKSVAEGNWCCVRK
jgi:hypothetical protein